MILTMTGAGQIELALQNLRTDTVVPNSKMLAAEFVLGNELTHCIIHKITYGNIKELAAKQHREIALIIYPRLRHTAHTKKGYVSIQITTKPTQFDVYIHTDHLENFLGRYAANMINSQLTH